jgi:hypothetical protein
MCVALSSEATRRIRRRGRTRKQEKKEKKEDNDESMMIFVMPSADFVDEDQGEQEDSSPTRQGSFIICVWPFCSFQVMI